MINGSHVAAASAHSHKVLPQTKTRLFCFALGHITPPHGGLFSYINIPIPFFLMYHSKLAETPPDFRKAVSRHAISLFLRDC